MMLSRFVAIAALVATAVPATGCYYTFGTAPPSDARRGRAGCTSSRALPIADTVLAVEGLLALGFGVWALAAIEDDGSLSAGEGQAGGGLFAVTGAVMLVGNGLSARAGFRDSAACRAR